MPTMQALKGASARRRMAPTPPIGRLADHATIEHYKSATREVRAGSDLFRSGEPCDGIYSLIDGCMFLYDLFEDGRRQILHFAVPGAVLGRYPDRTAVYNAQALTDAVVCLIPHGSLSRLFEERPDAGLRLTLRVWQERNLAYDHLSTIGRRSARERIARLLLELFIRYRMRWPGHRIEEMHLPLTQEHVGDATGLSNVHVNRVLRDMRKAEIVEFHYRRLRIINPDKLVDIAGIDPQTALSWVQNDDSPDETITPLIFRNVKSFPRGPSVAPRGKPAVYTSAHRGQSEMLQSG